jgi:hypothetical protein
VFYPNWDDELRQSLKRESELFFESIVREDRNVVDLLTGRLHLRERAAGAGTTGFPTSTARASGA